MSAEDVLLFFRGLRLNQTQSGIMDNSDVRNKWQSAQMFKIAVECLGRCR